MAADGLCPGRGIVDVFHSARRPAAARTAAQSRGSGARRRRQAAGGIGRSEAEPAPKPRYDFYSVLPEMEVVIPDAELKAQSAQPTATTPPAAAAAAQAPAAAQRLFLQVASFGNSGDAEAVKARLALLGVQAQVVPVTINGSTWHRVRVGPYGDARALESAKRELAANNFEAIALRER